MAKIISVLSGKGGTGKTLFAVSIGVYLALQGKKVLIMDTNFQSRGVDLALGMEAKVIYDIVDVIRGNCRIKQAIVRNRDYKSLYIMEPPIVNKGAGVRLMELGILLDRVKPDFDYIIIDTSNYSSEAAEGFAEKSDYIMVITTQDPISVRSGQNLISRIKARTDGKIKLLINQVKLNLSDRGYLTDVEEIAEAFGTDICGVVPYDDSMHAAFNNGRPVVSIKDSEAADHINRVIERFIEE